MTHPFPPGTPVICDYEGEERTGFVIEHYGSDNRAMQSYYSIGVFPWTKVPRPSEWFVAFESETRPAEVTSISQ